MSRPEVLTRAQRWLVAALLLASFALRLAYAAVELRPGRFYDERYSQENVRHAVEAGTLRPANGWYPSLSYLPQVPLVAAAHLLHQKTGKAALSPFTPETFSPLGFFLCRLPVTVFATLSLWLVFLIGRRLFSPAVGLLAALVVSSLPLHLRLSAMFKPDMLMLLLVLTAFYLALRAFEEPSPRRFLVAGFAFGLAMASKFTAAAAAAPLALAALLAPWGETGGRRLARVAASGVLAFGVAAVTFLLLNPNLALYRGYHERNQRIYEERGALEGGDRWQALRGEVELLVSAEGFGPALGAFALLAALVLIGAALRPGAGELRPRALLLLSFPTAYSVLYALATTYAKSNNFLPVVTFLALPAAWLAVAAARRLAARLPAPWERRALALTAALAALWLGGGAVRFVHAGVVPTTGYQVETFLRDQLEPLATRLIVYESRGETMLVKQERNKVTMVAVEELETLDPARRLRADAEVFYGRGAPPEAAAWPLHTFGGLPWRARGPARTVALHPWQLMGEPVELALRPAGPGRFLLTPPPAESPDEAFSLEVWIPLTLESGPRVFLQEEELPTHWNRQRGQLQRYVSERFPAEGAEALRLEVAGARRQNHGLRAFVYRWLPPISPPNTSPAADDPAP